MENIKRFFQQPLSLLFALFFFLPFERMYDRFFRKFLLAKTSLSKEVIYSLYIYPSDVILTVVLLVCLCKTRIYKQLFYDSASSLLVFSLCFLLLPLCLSEGVHIAHFFKFYHFFLAALSFIFLFSLFRSTAISPFLPLLARFVIAFGCVQIGVCFFQYFFQKEVGIHFLAEPKFTKESYQFIVKAPAHCKTLIDYLLFRPQQTGRLFRAYGTFPCPNVLSAFLLFYFPFLLALFQNGKKKWLYGSLTFLCIFAVFLTFSRAAFLTLFVVSLLFLAVNKYQRKTVKKSFFLLFFSGLIATSLVSPILFYRFNLDAQQIFSKQADDRRSAASKNAWEVAKDHLLWGAGHSRFTEDSLEKLPPKTPHGGYIVHNMYLLQLVEGGFLGAGCFFLFLLLTLFKGLKRSEDPYIFALTLGFFSFCFLGFFDYFFLYFQGPRLLLFYVAALIHGSCYARQIYHFNPELQKL